RCTDDLGQSLPRWPPDAAGTVREASERDAGDQAQARVTRHASRILSPEGTGGLDRDGAAPVVVGLPGPHAATSTVLADSKDSTAASLYRTAAPILMYSTPSPLARRFARCPVLTPQRAESCRAVSMTGAASVLLCTCDHPWRSVSP